MESQTLASQLRRPSGEKAVDVACRMNEANRSLNRRCINLLRPEASDSVLEIGPGNGAFADDIVGVAENVSYVGLDWSAEMVAEAERINKHLIGRGKARFRQGSSEKIPFESGVFDKVLTVHTLYFWGEPGDHLAEIRRVLKPEGLFCIAYGDRSFMKDLPFVQYGFNLFDEKEARTLLNSSGFRVREVIQHQESGLSNTGDLVDKITNIALCEA